MLTRLSDFTVDYNKESHLILPFSSLPEKSEVYKDEKGTIFIKTYRYLFAVTDDEDIDEDKLSHFKNVKHIIYPSTKDSGDMRYLMHKDNSTNENEADIDIEELANFYSQTAFYDVDEEYLSERKAAGEYFFTYKINNEIVSAAYTNKERHMLVNVATRCDLMNKGYATALLKKTPSLYLFSDTKELEEFYRKRGFESVRKYRVIERRL